MKYTLLRHATALLDYSRRRFLVDPVLGGMPAPGAEPDFRAPITPLPENAWDVINQTDALLVSHLHFDHFDEAASRSLPKSLPVLGQPEDVAPLRDHGFEFVTGIAQTTSAGDITVIRTIAQHGHGEAASVFAPASGFVLHTPGEPTVYLVGDSVWCDEVEEAIQAYKPEVIILNGGAAHARGMGPITMDVDDLIRVRKTTEAEIVIVHLDAFGHMTQSREFIAEALQQAGLRDAFHIPADGESLTFTAPSSK